MPSIRRIAKWAAWIVAGILALGALLDSFANAVTIVNPYATYIGTAVLITAWLFAEATAQLIGIPWITLDGQRVMISSLGGQIRGGLFGIVLLLWVPRLGDLPTNSETVPPVSLHLYNPSPDTVYVGRRGEIVLWFPSSMHAGVRRMGGAFKFMRDDESGDIDSPLMVPPDSSLLVRAEIANEEKMAQLLNRSDLQLSLNARTNQGMSMSSTIPFVRRGLNSRILKWDISE